MKIVSTILAAGAVLLLTVATVFGSEHERQEGKEYKHYERGESKFYGTVERIPEATLGTWTVNAPCNSEGGFTFQSLTCCSID